MSRTQYCCALRIKPVPTCDRAVLDVSPLGRCPWLSAEGGKGCHSHVENPSLQAQNRLRSGPWSATSPSATRALIVFHSLVVRALLCPLQLESALGAGAFEKG